LSRHGERRQGRSPFSSAAYRRGIGCRSIPQPSSRLTEQKSDERAGGKSVWNAFAAGGGPSFSLGQRPSNQNQVGNRGAAATSSPNADGTIIICEFSRQSSVGEAAPFSHRWRPGGITHPFAEVRQFRPWSLVEKFPFLARFRLVENQHASLLSGALFAHLSPASKIPFPAAG
jgi:hypothetical protein